MICLSRPYPFKFFKGYFPQLLFGPLLNTLNHFIITKEFEEEISCLGENNEKYKTFLVPIKK